MTSYKDKTFLIEGVDWCFSCFSHGQLYLTQNQEIIHVDSGPEMTIVIYKEAVLYNYNDRKILQFQL